MTVDRILLYFFKINVFSHFRRGGLLIAGLAVRVGLRRTAGICRRALAVHLLKLPAHIPGGPVNGNQESSHKAVNKISQQYLQKNVHTIQN